jgi:hypothetical protein
MKCAYKILMEEPKGTNKFRNLGVEEKVFKMDNKKWGVMVWIGPCQGSAFLYQYHFFPPRFILSYRGVERVPPKHRSPCTKQFLQSISFPNHCSLIILPIDDIQSEILTASLNQQNSRISVSKS